jgi:hypothetical protein
MKKKLIVGCIVLIVAGVVVFHLAWEKEGQVSTVSCISSISQLLLDPKAPQVGTPTQLKAGWNVLEDAQAQRLMAEIWEYCDCGGPSWRWQRTRPGFDHWGHPLRVAVRQEANGKLSYLVWSAGPDGVSGTKDDITLMGQSTPLTP